MSGAVGDWGALKASSDHVLSHPFSGSSPDESPIIPTACQHLKHGSGGFATLASPEQEESREGEEKESMQADSDSGSLGVRDLISLAVAFRPLITFVVFVFYFPASC
jgi:hypothetical protein